MRLVCVIVVCLLNAADLQNPESDENNSIEQNPDSQELDYVDEGTPSNQNPQNDNEPKAEDQEISELELACPDLSGQIIGGTPSSVSRHPYQVSMVINGNSFCGGFIISRDYVLTAAHCVRGVSPSRIRLRVGSTRRDAGGQIVAVSNVTVHAQYGNPRFDNDIAALRLAQPLTFTQRIRPVRLPTLRQPVPAARLVVTGWGLTAIRGRRIPRLMMEARVPVVPQWLCRLSYGSALTNNMFCGGHFLIGGVSSCQGDSGGPAVFRGVSYGVVSFARGCALPLSPTVFTNIASLRTWVTDNTGVYEMFLSGYEFKVLSPTFTIHWGLQKKKKRPHWREKQNYANGKLFETFKRELFARYRKDPLHLIRRPSYKSSKKT